MPIIKNDASILANFFYIDKDHQILFMGGPYKCYKSKMVDNR